MLTKIVGYTIIIKEFQSFYLGLKEVKLKMKLSTKGRYGLKAMFDLAMNNGKGLFLLEVLLKGNKFRIII